MLIAPDVAPDDPGFAEVIPEPAAASVPPVTQRRVLGLAVPIIGENLLHTSVSAVDVFMVAQLGAVAVAGVGMSIELVYFMIAILSSVSVGATVLIAQAIGAGDRARADRLARQGVIWGLILAGPISIGGYLAAPRLISIFGTEPDVAAAAVTYFEIIAATIVILLLSFMCSAILRGAGDSRTPLAAAALANVVNVFAAWLLIFGNWGLPALGVAGSAWAAVLGRGAGAILLLILLFGGRRALSLRGRAGWFPHVQTARNLFRLGIPAGLEQMLTSAGYATLIVVVALIGTAALAAQQIAFTALSLGYMPALAFGVAATALVGQSIGARNLDGAKASVAIALHWGLVMMTASAVGLIVFATQLVGLFSSEADVIEAGAGALVVLGFSLPATAIWQVCGGALRGSGDTRSPMLASVVATWLAVGLALVAVREFGAGLSVVWLMYTITTHIAALSNWIVLRRRLANYRYTLP